MSPARSRTAEELARTVGALHRVVDEAVAELRAGLTGELRCQPGCRDCCVDGVTVFEVEAAWIRLGQVGELPGPVGGAGACAFLDPAGRCRVYDRRPYVCRTQGLPLRWLDEEPSGEVVERRDICLLNDEAVDLLALPEDQCWVLGPIEGRLAALQAELDGGALRRLGLRQLAQELSSRGSPRPRCKPGPA